MSKEDKNNAVLIAGFLMVVPWIFSSLIPVDLQLIITRIGMMIYLYAVMFMK